MARSAGRSRTPPGHGRGVTAADWSSGPLGAVTSMVAAVAAAILRGQEGTPLCCVRGRSRPLGGDATARSPGPPGGTPRPGLSAMWRGRPPSAPRARGWTPLAGRSRIRRRGGGGTATSPAAVRMGPRLGQSTTAALLLQLCSLSPHSRRLGKEQRGGAALGALGRLGAAAGCGGCGRTRPRGVGVTRGSVSRSGQSPAAATEAPAGRSPTSPTAHDGTGRHRDEVKAAARW